MRPRVASVLAVVLSGLVSGAAPGVPADRPLAPQTEPALTAQEILDRARQAYRAQPIAERISIAVRDGDTVRFDEFTIRLHAGGDLREIRIDFATLAVWAHTDGSAGRLVAAHPENDQLVYTADLHETLSRRSLAMHMPPVVAPQLALAFGESVTPGLNDDAWIAAPATAGLVSIVSAGGEATLLLDARTNRLREFRREIGAAEIRLRIDPLEPADPTSWRIAPHNRRIVASLSELRPGPRPIAVGGEFTLEEFHDATMSPWPIGAALISRSVPPQRPEERYLVLVFHRVPDDVQTRRQLLARVERAVDAGQSVERELSRLSMREGLGPRRAIIRVIVRPVACLRVPDARRETIEELARLWPLDTGGSGLLWTLSPELTLDRLSPGSGAAVAIVDDQLRLVAVLPIGDEHAELEPQIRSAIMREVELLPESPEPP